MLPIIQQVVDASLQSSDLIQVVKTNDLHNTQALINAKASVHLLTTNKTKKSLLDIAVDNQSSPMIELLMKHKAPMLFNGCPLLERSIANNDANSFQSLVAYGAFLNNHDIFSENKRDAVIWYHHIFKTLKTTNDQKQVPDAWIPFCLANNQVAAVMYQHFPNQIIPDHYWSHISNCDVLTLIINKLKSGQHLSVAHLDKIFQYISTTQLVLGNFTTDPITLDLINQPNRSFIIWCSIVKVYHATHGTKSLNNLDSQGHTLLSFATWHRQLDRVRYLLQLGADPLGLCIIQLTNNAKIDHHFSPIALAVWVGDISIVDTLIDHHALMIDSDDGNSQPKPFERGDNLEEMSHPLIVLQNPCLTNEQQQCIDRVLEVVPDLVHVTSLGRSVQDFCHPANQHRCGWYYKNDIIYRCAMMAVVLVGWYWFM